MTKNIAVGDAKLKRQHVGIRQHGEDNPGEQQARGNNPGAQPQSEANRHSGVGNDRWHKNYPWQSMEI